jgi:ATP-dependent Clp protease adaptor protein ClpS
MQTQLRVNRAMKGFSHEGRGGPACARRADGSPRYNLPMATQRPNVPQKPSVLPPGDGEVVLERVPLKVGPPKMYQVVMLNDDFTPMEFVVLVLQEFFSMDRDTATQVMLKIHLDGRAVCGVFTRDVATTKVDRVSDAAQQAGHPLQCVCEPVE